MLTADELAARRAEIAAEGDLPALLASLHQRAAPLLERAPHVPDVKAELSTTGGVCPSCGAPLRFDPWEPARHRCSACGRTAEGDRHHAHWARAQHLWLAERAAHLAAVGVLAGQEPFVVRARELLAAYFERYFALPNRDNVLGPAHLFFSTYLESMWLTSYLAAAALLREAGRLEPAEVDGVSAIADEAANLIGEFVEGGSNRQVWNAAALAAIAAWFGDDELTATAAHGRHGLLGLLMDGFGDDGLWHEGENYHLFAMRGLLVGAAWARRGGLDLLATPELEDHLAHALMAPAATALPDFTFPARKDARFGVSLAHPAYLESWEAGLTLLGDAAPAELAPWLHALYRVTARPELTYDAYLHDAGLPERSATRRTDLSWWMLLAMTPSLPPDTMPWRPASVLLPDQGLAILRRNDRYASLECGGGPEGHGHPDALHLTLHAGGVHWLPDPGAGSYVQRDLFWYRSPLAHNVPVPAAGGSLSRGRCIAFEAAGDWGWMQAEAGGIRRSVVAGPDWILDVVDASDAGVDLSWHFAGTTAIETPGTLHSDRIDSEFVTDVSRLDPAAAGPPRVTAASDGRQLRAWLAEGVVLRAEAPGLPGAAGRSTLIVARRATGGRLVTLLDLAGTVTDLAVAGEDVVVTAATGPYRVAVDDGSAVVAGGGATVTLGGARPPERPARPGRERDEPARGAALRVDEPPALDGTLDGWDLAHPIELADELHYRRSEEPWEGPERFSAVAYVNWDERFLYVAVDVVKPEVVVRRPDEPPLGLDNEPDDIHSDGVQVYYRCGADGSDRTSGFLIRPADDGGIWVRPIPGPATELVELEGGSLATEDGWRLTVALPCPGLQLRHENPAVEFEIMVNELTPDRVRRAGQLAWAGGGGWVYLRGDRAGPLGVLELAG